jgi:hypothetical protein
MPCYLCGEPRISYLGYFCVGCSKYQNLCELYSPSVVHNLLEKALLINETKIEAKVERQLKDIRK